MSEFIQSPSPPHDGEPRLCWRHRPGPARSPPCTAAGPPFAPAAAAPGGFGGFAGGEKRPKMVRSSATEHGFCSYFFIFCSYFSTPIQTEGLGRDMIRSFSDSWLSNASAKMTCRNNHPLSVHFCLDECQIFQNPKCFWRYSPMYQLVQKSSKTRLSSSPKSWKLYHESCYIYIPLYSHSYPKKTQFSMVKSPVFLSSVRAKTALPWPRTLVAACVHWAHAPGCEFPAGNSWVWQVYHDKLINPRFFYGFINPGIR